MAASKPARTGRQAHTAQRAGDRLQAVRHQLPLRSHDHELLDLERAVFGSMTRLLVFLACLLGFEFLLAAAPIGRNSRLSSSHRLSWFFLCLWVGSCVSHASVLNMQCKEYLSSMKGTSPNRCNPESVETKRLRCNCQS